MSIVKKVKTEEVKDIDKIFNVLKEYIEIPEKVTEMELRLVGDTSIQSTVKITYLVVETDAKH